MAGAKYKRHVLTNAGCEAVNDEVFGGTSECVSTIMIIGRFSGMQSRMSRELAVFNTDDVSSGSPSSRISTRMRYASRSTACDVASPSSYEGMSRVVVCRTTSIVRYPAMTQPVLTCTASRQERREVSQCDWADLCRLHIASAVKQIVA